MKGLFNELSDRLVQRLVPRIEAAAETSWTRYCYCRCYSHGCYHMVQECHIIGGTSGCGPCYQVAVYC